MNTKKLTLSGLFVALGIVLPLLTGQIPEIGGALLPMHFPVLLSGYVCGWQYGLMVGFITPILRSTMFGVPVLMPKAVTMAFELAAYGAMTGLLYKVLPKKDINIYISLIGAMMAGRLVWGIACIPIYGMVGDAFGMQMFLSGAFISAVPGIVLQIVIVPLLVLALRKAGYVEVGTVKASVMEA